MLDFILIVLLAGILGSVADYLYKAKKNGQHCVGCPNAKQCAGNCGGGCNHSHHVEVHH